MNNAASGYSTVSDEFSTTAQIPSITENPTEVIITSEPAQTTPVINTEEPGVTTQPPAEPTRVAFADTPAGTYSAVECYPDNDGNGYPLAPPITDSVDPSHYDTPEHCIEHCSTANLGRAFRYAGISPGHCYCSNTLLSAEPTAECNYQCPGNPTKICGGGAPPTRRLRRRGPSIAILIYELIGFVPETSSAATETFPIETPGVTTTDIIPNETESVTPTEIIVTEEPVITSSTEAISNETQTEVVVTEEPILTSTTEVIPNETQSVAPTEVIITEEPILTSTTEAVLNETPAISSIGESAGESSTGVPPVSNDVSGSGSTTLGAESTSVFPIDQPGFTSNTAAVGTEQPISTTSEVIDSEQPASTNEVIGTEQPITITEGVATEQPISTTNIVNSEQPASTNGVIATEQPISTTEAIISEQLTSTTPVFNTEEPSGTGTGIPPVQNVVSGSLTTSGEPESTTEAILPTGQEGTTTAPSFTNEPGVDSTALISTVAISETSTGIETNLDSPTSTSEVGEGGGTTTSALPSSTQGGEAIETTTSIPSITTSTLDLTTSPPASASSVAPSYNYVCSGAPSQFNVIIDEPGKPKQWLTQLNFPDAGTFEGTWGYDTLLAVTQGSQAARFSIGFGNTFQGKLQSNGAPITGAVRLTALGSPLQLFTAAHISDNMRTFTASIGADCSLGLDIPNTGDNILAQCEGVFTILTPAKQLQRGSGCTQVRAYAVAYDGSQSTISSSIEPTRTMIPSSDLVTSTSTFSPITSSTTIAGCPVAPYFRILVNETGMPPQYLWDPVSFGDDALSFTNDASKSLTFSLSPTTGQLQFNIVDFFGNPVLLASNQDTHNAGNEAIFFSTATKYQQLGYQPVVATIKPDCSIGLTLPYNAANIIQACHGSIYLMLTPGKDCNTVSLLMLPYNPYATITSSTATTTSFLV